MLTLNVPSGLPVKRFDYLTKIVQASTAPILASIGFTDTEIGRAYKVWLIQEDGLTDGDGRLYVGPIGWRDGRLPFTFSDVEGDPHEEARHVGNLDNVRREMRGSESWVVADLDWDTDELALEAKRLVDEERITGVSVHPTEAEGWFLCGVPSNPTAETVKALSEQLTEEEWAACDEQILAFTNVVIGAATLLMLPAFGDAEVEPMAASAVPVATEDLAVTGWDSPLTVQTITPSDPATWGQIWTGLLDDAKAGPIQAAASLDRPPKEWFENPAFGTDASDDGRLVWDDKHHQWGCALTVNDDGRVFGHLALWNSCHTGFNGKCIHPERNTDYSYYQTCRVFTQEGERIGVGPLVVDDGHTPPSWATEKVLRYYADTRLAAAYVNVGEDDHGVWVAGAISHKATPSQVETLRRHPLSGEWRKQAGVTRLVAAVSVNAPGFMVPEVLVASTGEDIGLITYGPAPIVDEPSDLALVAAALTRLTELVEKQQPVVNNYAPLTITNPSLDEELEAEVDVALALDA